MTDRPYTKNAPRLIQNIIWQLFNILLTDILFQYFLAERPPNFQEVRELDDYTPVVSW